MATKLRMFTIAKNEIRCWPIQRRVICCLQLLCLTIKSRWLKTNGKSGKNLNLNWRREITNTNQVNTHKLFRPKILIDEASIRIHTNYEMGYCLQAKC